MKSLLFIFFLSSFVCTPLQNTSVKADMQKMILGFSGENSFQVVCDLDISSFHNKTERRRQLLQECRKLIVETLAEYKISYDYNLKDLYFNSEKSTFTGAPTAIRKVNWKPATPFESYKGNTNQEFHVRIHKLGQVNLSWNSPQVDSLLNLYKDLFPGRILLEWNDENRDYFLYRITQNGLLNKIKNTSLPFAIEIQ